MSDRLTAADLLPLVYDELRAMAARALAAESPAHTLQPTDLVHEVYLKLSSKSDPARWVGRRHFLCAAGEAMRRILVNHAVRRRTLRRGGGRGRVELTDDIAVEAREDELLLVDELIDSLAAQDPELGDLIRLHVFAGLTIKQIADELGLSERTAYRKWAYARARIARRRGEA